MKRGTIEHPKTAALARELGVPLLTAVGLLEALWHFTAKYAPQGDVGRFSHRDIASGCHWTLADGRPCDSDGLIKALLETGWLEQDPEHRLLVHDWHEHADNGVRLTLKNRGLDFLRTAHRTGARTDTRTAHRTDTPNGAPYEAPHGAPSQGKARQGKALQSSPSSEIPPPNPPRTAGGDREEKPKVKKDRRGRRLGL